MAVESQYPPPEPTPAFRAVLAALRTLLLPDHIAREDGLEWELEQALKQWVDERLDSLFEELWAHQKYLLEKEKQR